MSKLPCGQRYCEYHACPLVIIAELFPPPYGAGRGCCGGGQGDQAASDQADDQAGGQAADAVPAAEVGDGGR